MKPRSGQRGATLLVMATVLVLGFAWFVVGALGKNAVTPAEREAKTAAALQAGKKALLSHVAQYAGRTDFEFPGRMPCPESLAAYGNPANEGVALGGVACDNTVAQIGRLPWKTLGIDQLRDGDGEPLWYALSPNFHPVTFPLNAAPPNPYLNFGTPAALPFDGSNVVAVILAPGRALQSNPCSAVNQQVNRYANPPGLSPAKFFECGNATGSYTNPGSGAGSNDRVLAITHAEWVNAITGAVADRIQRQVAPALIDWRTNEASTNWGELFLPYASSFSNPASNNLCGSYNVREGLMPLARATSGCTEWTGGSVTALSGSLNSVSCAQVAGSYECRFVNATAGSLSARIRARAPSVGGSFRARITAAGISGYQALGGTLGNFSLTLDNADGDADLDFRLSFPFLSAGQQVVATIPNLPDAALLSTPGMRWFVENDWARHTYYAISHGVKLEPTGLTCNPTSYEDCLELNGVARQRFVVALVGPPLATQSRSCGTDIDSDGIIDCNDRSQYIESRTSSNIWHQDRIDASFNDRVATCPFEVAPASGIPVPLC